MPFLKTVAERRLQPEIIDQPELTPDLLTAGMEILVEYDRGLAESRG